MEFGNVRQSYKRNNLIYSFCILVYIIFLPTYILPQSNDDCLTCHGDNTLTTERNGKEVSLYVDQKLFDHSAHAKLQCISCHTGFNIDEIPHKENIQPINCESCHADAPIKHPFHPQMINANGINGGKDVNCKGCHGTHDVISPKVSGSEFSNANIVTACGNCHSEEKKEFLTSAHANGIREGIKGAPNCFTCHKNPVVPFGSLTDQTQLKLNQTKLCLSCHLDNPEIRARTSPSAGFIASYTNSVHGKALEAGNGQAANCVNCHTAHRVKPPGDPNSNINRLNIPNTCGQCHGDIEKEYKESIHGTAALQKGSTDAPVCVTCHGEHNILKPSNPLAPTAPANVSQQVCSRCHASVTLAAKYGLNPNRLTTFKDSYHGLALEGGQTTVANCGSCHGVHLILPASDPKSSVFKGNLANTCGKCHPGANQNFAVGKVHVSSKTKEEPILYWISLVYIILIIATIGAMLLHNILDFIKKSKIKKLKQRGLIRSYPVGHSLYLRMTMSERMQHLALTISFITLVITGFMLKYPDSWWVSHIRSLSENAFTYRSLLHRISAVILIVTSLYHLYYIIFTGRGRMLVKDLLPNHNDLKEAIGVAKFNLGLSKEKPKLGRFSYIEKAEYWALIWGTIIMSVTGIFMWFDNTFIGLFTKLGWDIASTIHYYEAWLATLAIIVWHFYFVIFNPDIYPMNTSWITGKISEEEMAEEHPAELEEFKKKDEGDTESDYKAEDEK
jgi:formate dehydrogenase gamma subunit